MTEFESAALALLAEIRDACVDIRDSTAANETKLDLLADHALAAGMQTEMAIREGKETRFALLDAINGTPENFHWSLDYIKNELPKDYAAGGRLQRRAKQQGASPELLERCLRKASPEQLKTVAVVSVDADGKRTLITGNGSAASIAATVAEARSAGIVFEGDGR